MTDKTLISRFTPSRTPPEVLEAIFVQRQDLLADAIERIEEGATTGNKHHLLYVAPRGCGKTHLVTLINHRVSALDSVQDKLRIAWLNEDEISTSFLDLLIRIYRALAERHPDEFPPDELQALFELDGDRALEQLQSLLLEQLQSHTLLLLVENLDELFDGLGEQGQRQWRAFLQEHPVTTIVATAQQLFDGVSRRKSPFFGFFQAQHLKPLAIEQATELLQHIARYHGDDDLAKFMVSRKGRARIEAVYHLSGGNHRVYIVLSEFISREALDELVSAFEKMLDELTPYYHERLRWLPPLQRRIAQYLCRIEAPVSVKHIAKQLFTSHQTTSSQLKDLRKKGYVKNHTRGRESLYELAEPLMRLCVEVKENNRQPIRLIVRFLRAWYSDDQLARIQGKYTEPSPARRYLEAAFNYEKDNRAQIATINRTVMQPEEEKNEGLLQLAKGLELMNKGDLESSLHVFTAVLDIKDATTEQKAWVYYNRGVIYRMLGDTDREIANYNHMLSIPGALIEQKALALVNRGIAHKQLGEIDKVLTDYNSVLNMPNAPIEQKSKALINRGNLYADLDKFNEAITDLSDVQAIDGVYSDQKALALVNRAVLYSSLGRSKEAIKDYEAVLDMPDVSIEQKAKALFNRGTFYHQLGKIEKALTDFSSVIMIEEDIVLREKTKALINRGFIYAQIGKRTKAINDCSAIIDMHEVSMEEKANALINRGIYYQKFGEINKAIDDYNAVLKMDEASHDNIAAALYNRGNLYFRDGDNDKALADYIHAFEIEGGSNATKAKALTNSGVIQDHFGNYDIALDYYDKAIALDSNQPPSQFNQVETLLQLDRWQDAWTALEEALNRFPPSESNADTVAMINIIAASASVAKTWSARVKKLAELYRNADALSYLGTGLVQSLASTPLKESALDTWLKVWQTVCANDTDMKIPLRIFKTGYRYLQTQDARVLFDLIAEERRILADALQIDLPD